jgi:hypothetical protein
MAQVIVSVTAYLKALARGDAAEAPPVPADADRHIGYADRAMADIDGAILKDLRGVKHRLDELIAQKIVHKCI